jgi:hypothetical protein
MAEPPEKRCPCRWLMTREGPQRVKARRLSGIRFNLPTFQRAGEPLTDLYERNDALSLNE